MRPSLQDYVVRKFPCLKRIHLAPTTENIKADARGGKAQLKQWTKMGFDACGLWHKCGFFLSVNVEEYGLRWLVWTVTGDNLSQLSTSISFISQWTSLLLKPRPISEKKESRIHRSQSVRENEIGGAVLAFCKLQSVICVEKALKRLSADKYNSYYSGCLLR